ncbi:MAG: M23 family metallopeptidase [Chloroflexi bacterium]|nr:M23 family metallopeptidase [Chloroflexota bacterium]
MPETSPPNRNTNEVSVPRTVADASAADAEPHFWLSRPLPGGDRFLTNDWLPYGWDAYRYLLHNGTDVAEPQGTPLLAAADGTVVTAGEDVNELYGWRCDWYGHLVVVQLDDLWQGQPVYFLYGHVQNIVVRSGATRLPG